MARTGHADDVIAQTAEDRRVAIPLFHSQEACAGAVTSSLLRHIAYTAGAYAPGIQEHIFFEPNTARDGGSIGKVESWFTRRLASFHEIGYRLHCRRITEPTGNILTWVQQGLGYRAAMMPVKYDPIHPGGDGDLMQYALGFTVSGAAGAVGKNKSTALTMLDPWPGPGNSDQVKLSEPFSSDPLWKSLDRAHRDQKYASLIFFWVGWS